MVTITGTVSHADGTLYSGSIQFKPLASPLWVSGVAVLTSPINVTVASDGTFSVDLYAGRYQVDHRLRAVAENLNGPMIIRVPNDTLTSDWEDLLESSTPLPDFFGGLPEAGSGSVEGTAVLSTGETGGVKFLGEDGDGTSSWKTLAGGGDALVAGTLDQFANVTQTAGQTLAITSSTTLAGGTHSGTNTGDQSLAAYATTSAVAAGYQPLDSDLTAIAALATTSFGRSHLTEADAAAGRTLLALGTAATSATGDFAAASHSHAASDITSGVLDHARLGSGGGGSTKFLREDNTFQTISGGGDALVASSLDQFADVTQTAGQTLAITSSTTLAGGTHSGTNTGDNAVNSNYSGLVSNATHTGDATGSAALTVVAINGVNLAGLATGIVKNTTATGAPSIAVAGDFPTLNQNTTGSAASCTGNAATASAVAASGITAGVLGGDITLGESTGQIILDPALSADGKWSGICEAGTAGATLSFGDLCYLAVADSRWELADANVPAASAGVKLGICVLAAAADGNATTMLLLGKVRADTAFPTMTVGAPQYISTTAGDIVSGASGASTTGQPSATDDIIRVVGFANTADELFFCPSTDYMTHT